MGAWETQLRKGLVELAALAVIARGETYGYRILEELQRHPGLEFTESTLYPVLTRLAREGMLSVREERSPAGPTRRYYRLNPAGREQLEAMSVAWEKVRGSLSRILEGAKT